MKKLFLAIILSCLFTNSTWALSPVFLQLVSSGSGQFDTWGRKCALVIQHGQVTDNETNYPLTILKASLPDEIFDADGSYSALNGGGDIRFTSDSMGYMRLSCEIEQFVTDNDPANGKCAIHVKVPSVSSTVNTTIYIWYNKAGQSQPAVDAAYGAESVWSSKYMMVQHMNEDPSSSQTIDSTSYDNDGTTAGTMLTEDLVAGQVGNCLDFDGTDDRTVVSHSTSIDFADEDFSVSFWFKTSTAKTRNYTFSKNYGGDTVKWYGSTIFTDGPYINSSLDDGTTNSSVTTTDDYNDGAFHYFVITRNTTTNKLTAYIDGQQNAQNNDLSGSITNTGDLVIGGRSDFDVDRFFEDLIDEFRIVDEVFSAGWIETTYNNQNAPATFLIEGTPEGLCDDCSGSLKFAWHMEDNDATPDVTLGNPCGCSDGDTIGAETGSPVFSTTQKSDGSYSLHINALFERYEFAISADDICEADNVKITFDLYIVSYPSAGASHNIIEVNKDGNNYTKIRLTGTTSSVAVEYHANGTASDYLTVAVSTGAWVSCEYQAKTGIGDNDHYLKCGENSDEDDDDLVAMDGSLSSLVFGDTNGSGVGEYYVDNVKVYPCDRY